MRSVLPASLAGQVVQTLVDADGSPRFRLRDGRWVRVNRLTRELEYSPEGNGPGAGLDVPAAAAAKAASRH